MRKGGSPARLQVQQQPQLGSQGTQELKGPFGVVLCWAEMAAAFMLSL